MGLTVRKCHRQRQGCSHLRYGSTRQEKLALESLEPRTVLTTIPLDVGSVCLVPGEHQTVSGEIFFIDDVAYYDAVTSPVPVNDDVYVDLSRVPILHSDPEAEQKIFLDFDGHVVSSTGWNEWNGGRPIQAPAFDIDGDPTRWSGTELAIIEEVWLRVAEDFAPFAIDVTTESPSGRSFREGSQAIRVLISSSVDAGSGQTWMHAGNGVAYLNSWRYETDTPVWVFSNRLGASGKRLAESASHELGHAFGLHHDGQHRHDEKEDDEYFAGHGNEDSGWAPIMGLGYHRPVTQWDHGEFELSNNLENDIAIIASEQNDVVLRLDDHHELLIFASPVPLYDAAYRANGLIATREDQDAFRFDLEPGTFQLTVSPMEVGTNLRLSVSFYGPQGQLLLTQVPHELNPVQFRYEVRYPGSYFAVVDGVGLGDAQFNGFSDYGSIGRYSLAGEEIPKVSAMARIRNAAQRRVD